MASAAALLLAAAVVVLLACLALADPPGEAIGAWRSRGYLQSASSVGAHAAAQVGHCDAANSTVIAAPTGVGLVGPIPPSTISRLTNLR
ncbi:hypothetical protein ZWY2020_057680 [Hordeum vulgare]|nr:hypothetical protein ZWY2020_057680 [Hordeum vulgare]